MISSNKEKFKNIFISTMTNSGSTLIQNFLNTSENVIKHHSYNEEGMMQIRNHSKYPNSKFIEGGYIARIFTRNCNNVRNINNFKWDYIKDIWYNEWRSNLNESIINKYNNIYLLEKTPQNVIMCDFLEKEFDPSYFIICVRNPYAVCEGIVRSVIKAWNGTKKINYTISAIHWCECMEFQINNIKKLKNNIWFKYEDFCDNTEDIKNKLEEFLPETSFQTNSYYKAQKNNKKVIGSISNMNDEHISRLSDKNIEEINSILKNHKDIMEYFNYEYIN